MESNKIIKEISTLKDILSLSLPKIKKAKWLMKIKKCLIIHKTIFALMQIRKTHNVKFKIKIN